MSRWLACDPIRTGSFTAPIPFAHGEVVLQGWVSRDCRVEVGIAGRLHGHIQGLVRPFRVEHPHLLAGPLVPDQVRQPHPLPVSSSPEPESVSVPEPPEPPEPPLLSSALTPVIDPEPPPDESAGVSVVVPGVEVSSEPPEESGVPDSLPLPSPVPLPESEPPVPTPPATSYVKSSVQPPFPWGSSAHRR